MKFLSKYPLIAITIALMSGIFIEKYLQYQYIFLLTSWLSVFALLVFFHFRQNKILRRDRFFSLLLFILSLLTGMLLILRADERNNPVYYTQYLSGENQVFHLKILLQKKLRTSSRQNFTGKVIFMNGHSAEGKILLHFPLERQDISVGDYIDTYLDKTAIKPLRKALNPYAFDYRKYLEKQNIYREIFFQNQAYELDNTAENIYKFTADIRRHIKKYLASGGLTKQELAFAYTVLLGERHEISKESFKDFQTAGTIHILAISGLHVGILLLFLNLLFYPVKKISIVLFLFFSITFLWFFALLSGFSPSVVRAVLMFSLFQIGFHIKRESNTYNVLFATALIMLIYRPLYLFEVGFQMSFLAVWSILSFYPFLSKIFHSKYKLFQWWLDLFSISLAAQIGILPLSLYYFHQFPIYFWLANLFVVPLLFLVLFLGFSLMILSFFSLKFPFLFLIFGFMTDTLLMLNHKIADLPLALIQNISFGSFELIISLIAVFLFYLYLKKTASYHRLFAFIFALMVFQIGLIYQKQRIHKREHYYVLYQYHSPLVAVGKGERLCFYQPKDKINPYLFRNMKLHYSEIVYDTLPVFQQFQGKNILHIDSLGIYAYKDYHPDIIVLHYSPKINLERLIINLHPEMIIVDASNHYNLIEKWQKTAKNFKVDFYNINEEGAFILQKQ